MQATITAIIAAVITAAIVSVMTAALIHLQMIHQTMNHQEVFSAASSAEILIPRKQKILKITAVYNSKQSIPVI